TQYRILPLLQMLDLTGSYGLSFLMALFAAAVACCLSRRPRPDQGCAIFRSGLKWGAATVLLSALFTARGAWILGRSEPVGTSIRVAAVQASRSVSKGISVYSYPSPEEYAASTAAAVRQGAALVVWPETVCEEDVVHSEAARARLAGLVEGSRTHLL